MSDCPDNSHLALVESFKAYYRDLRLSHLDDLGLFYCDEIVFRDPIHEIRGLNNLHAYMNRMYLDVVSCHFDYLDQLISSERAYIKWNMTFVHSKMGDKPITVRGVTQIAFNEKIYFHEDVYDMGQLLYEHLPVLGGVTRWLKKRLK